LYFILKSSEYFRAMFLSGLKEAQEHEVDMALVSYPVFLAVQEFCYTGEIEVGCLPILSTI